MGIEIDGGIFIDKGPHTIAEKQICEKAGDKKYDYFLVLECTYAAGKSNEISFMEYALSARHAGNPDGQNFRGPMSDPVIIDYKGEKIPLRLVHFAGAETKNFGLADLESKLRKIDSLEAFQECVLADKFPNIRKK